MALHIEITDIDTGRVLVNENADAIVGGLSVGGRTASLGISKTNALDVSWAVLAAERSAMEIMKDEEVKKCACMLKKLVDAKGGLR